MTERETPEGNEVYSSFVTREDRIREYAHILWEWRVENDIPGDALGDWLKAEHEIDLLTPIWST